MPPNNGQQGSRYNNQQPPRLYNYNGNHDSGSRAPRDSCSSLSSVGSGGGSSGTEVPDDGRRRPSARGLGVGGPGGRGLEDRLGLHGDDHDTLNSSGGGTMPGENVYSRIRDLGLLSL